MFIVAWEGEQPADKQEWIETLREVLEGELGSYRVVFRRAERGWRFDLEWRDDGSADQELLANSPESVGYNIYVHLAGAGKPIDATWRPRYSGTPIAPGPPRTASSSRAGPPSRPGVERRRRRGR